MKKDQQSHRFIDLIGRTPLLLLTSFSTANAQIFAKLEGYNPGSSLYDRLALSLIERAERSLRLQSGSLLIDDSSSELSVSLAMAGAAKGYAVHCVISPELNAKTRQIITAYGASIEESSPNQTRSERVEELLQSHSESYWITNFHSLESVEDHPYEQSAHALAAEIYEALDGQVDACVFPLSAAHLLDDCARFLKTRNPNIRILALDDRTDAHQPANTPVPPAVDELVQVPEADSLQMCRELVIRESLLTGPRSGAVMHTAMQWAQSLPATQITPLRIVAILPDHGDRHLHWLQGDRVQEPASYVVQ